MRLRVIFLEGEGRRWNAWEFRQTKNMESDDSCDFFIFLEKKSIKHVGILIDRKYRVRWLRCGDIWDNKTMSYSPRKRRQRNTESDDSCDFFIFLEKKSIKHVGILIDRKYRVRWLRCGDIWDNKIMSYSPRKRREFRQTKKLESPSLRVRTLSF